MNDIIDIIKEKTLTIGTDKTIKNMKNGRTKGVFLAKDCKKETVDEITHLAKISSIEIVKLEQTNKEIGILCKKPFSISVLSY